MIQGICGLRQYKAMINDGTNFFKLYIKMKNKI